MSEFEYFMTLVSVVLAIGIAELASGWARFLALDPRPRIDPLFLFWGVYVAFSAINVWTLYWSYQQIEWAGYKVLLLLLQFVAVVFAAHFLTPRPEGQEPYDMNGQYWRLSRLVFPTLALMFLVSIPALIASAELTWAADQAYIVGYGAVVGLLGLATLTLAFVQRAWYHWGVGMLVTLMTAPPFLYFDFKLPIP